MSKSKKSPLTQAQLKALLHYDPITGVFTRRVALCHSVKVGDIAGWIGLMGYRQIHLIDRTYKASRLAWLYVYGKWPDQDLDHADGVKSHDAILNLRECTAPLNGGNRRLSKNNISGCKGVYWCKIRQLWKVQINAFGKRYYLGAFADFSEACKVRRQEAIKYFGEFARLE